MMTADVDAATIEQKMPLNDIVKELTALVIIHGLCNGGQNTRVPKP